MPVESLATLEHLAADAATRWADRGALEGGRLDAYEGGRVEARLCAAAGTLVDALRDATRAAAEAEASGVFVSATNVNANDAEKAAASSDEEAAAASSAPARDPGSPDDLEAFTRDAATPGTFFASPAGSSPRRSGVGVSPTEAFATPGTVDWARVERVTSPAVQRLNAIEASLAARRISMFEAMATRDAA